MEAPRAILLLLLTICSVLIIPVASGVSYKTYAGLMGAMQEKSWKISKGQPDPKSGEQLIKYEKGPKLSRPEEQGNYLEGDILFQSRPSGKRSLRNDEQYRWPNGIVYYKLASGFSAPEKTIITNAMTTISDASCIQFQVRSVNDPDYVLITRNQNGCYSDVGRQGGMQHLNLQSPGCMKKRTILHELMHTLGFFHEQSRTDRDLFVTIDFDNVLPDYRHNFDREDATDHLNIPYDYKSIMHYSRYACAINPTRQTINIKGDTNPGSRQDNIEMTPRDFMRIKALYSC